MNNKKNIQLVFKKKKLGKFVKTGKNTINEIRKNKQA